MINKFDTSNYIKYSSILLVSLVSVILFWGYFAPLSTLAVASGQVIVSGQNKPVQHLEGGIVKSILVNDGDSVKKDQLLLKIDDTQLKSEYKIMLQNITELKIKKDRLYAQKDNTKSIVYNKNINQYNLKSISTTKDLQTSIFNSRKELIETQIKIINKKIAGVYEQIEGIKTSIVNKSLYIKSIQEELDELQALYNDKLIDKIQLREIKRKKILLDNELSELNIQKSSLSLSITQNEEEILKIRAEFTSNILEDLKDTLSKINNLEEQIIASEDRLKKTNILSPIDGIVDNIQVFTKGSILSSGQTIMSIVPEKSPLIIQANLEITDVDIVKVGQASDIVFSAFDTKMTFSIDGIVKYISADRKVDKATNLPYYQVDIAITSNGYTQMKKDNFILKTGMPADVMIKTGTRSMLSYIIKPVLDMRLRSFNEE